MGLDEVLRRRRPLQADLPRVLVNQVDAAQFRISPDLGQIWSGDVGGSGLGLHPDLVPRPWLQVGDGLAVTQGSRDGRDRSRILASSFEFWSPGSGNVDFWVKAWGTMILRRFEYLSIWGSLLPPIISLFPIVGRQTNSGSAGASYPEVLGSNLTDGKTYQDGNKTSISVRMRFYNCLGLLEKRKKIFIHEDCLATQMSILLRKAWFKKMLISCRYQTTKAH